MRRLAAEVLVDGVSEGLTPLVLELERGRDHTVVVRLGLRERTVMMPSGVHTVPVVLSGAGTSYQLTPVEVVVAFDGS